MRLSALSKGRDNNFNLIRIIAAFAVLITHGFALSIGTGNAEPLRKSLGVTLGTIAVDVFFITSGFLITSSLMNRRHIIDFCWARVLRIFPALWLMLIITVFGISPLLTIIPLHAYIFNHTTYRYIIYCATLFHGVKFTLPGLFHGNPYKDAVNGSLWTLPWEVQMYSYLAIMWIGSLIIDKYNRHWIYGLIICMGVILFTIYTIHEYPTHHFRIKAVVAIMSLIIISYIAMVTGHTNKHTLFMIIICACSILSGLYVVIHNNDNNGGIQLFFMFFTGSVFFVLRDRIHLSTIAFVGVILALSLSVLNRLAFHFVYNLSLAYLVFYIAYIPSGYIRKYNRLGDYSYGVYIYAFFVEQSVAALMPGISVLHMILIAAPATLFFAAMSWHIVEKRALGLKEDCAAYTKRLLAFRLPHSLTPSG